MILIVIVCSLYLCMLFLCYFVLCILVLCFLSLFCLVSLFCLLFRIFIFYVLLLTFLLVVFFLFICLYFFSFFFFFKQKTAYDVRISDWSSDVCSSDLISDASVLADGGNIDIRGRAAGDPDPAGDTAAIGVRLGNTAEVGNALTATTRLAGESVDSGGFQTGLEVESGCGNGGACIGGDTVVLQPGTSDGSQALTLDGTVQGESVVNLRPGGVDANGLAYDRTGHTITIGAGGGFSIGATDLAHITHPETVIENGRAQVITTV